MEVAAGIAGLISLGLTVSKGIVAYYSSFQSANSDVQRTVESVRGIEEILKLLEARLCEPSLDRDIVDQVEDKISDCCGNFGKLKKILSKVDAVPKEDGWRAKCKAAAKRTLYPFKESTLAKIRENCGDVIRTLELSVQLLQLDITQKTKVSLAYATQALDTLTSRQERERCTQVHEWLSPLLGKAENRQLELSDLGARQDRGADRLMRSFEFVAWTTESGCTLWCIGAQGTGKTVVASIVINHLQSKTTPTNNVAVAYIFFNYKETESQSPSNVLAAICEQLMLQASDHLQGAVELFERHSPRKTRPSLQEYTTLLQDISRTFSRVFIVLDALDEAPEDNDSRRRLISQLKTLGHETSLLIFSRPLPNLESSLGDARTANIESQDEDIIAYIEERLSQCASITNHFAKDTNLRQKIINAVVPKSRGMFLMARLYVDSIISKGNRRRIKGALDTLPDGLPKTYDDAIDRMRAQDQYHSQLALRIIQWIFLAYRPLTLDEMKHALAVEPDDHELVADGIEDDDELISSCVGMVVVNEKSGFMAFVHFTFQEYLEQHGRRHFKSPGLELAQTCLTYLMFTNIAEERIEPLKNENNCIESSHYPLLSYSARYWGEHVRSCGCYEIIEDQVRTYLSQPRATFRVSTSSEASAYESDRHGPLQGREVSPLCVAASFGLSKTTEQLLRHSGYSDPKYGRARARALHIAVINDFPPVVEVLLRHDVDVNAPDGRGWTPLHHAASLGHAGMVSLLLQNNADPKILDGYREAALSRAAEAGHSTIVNILLDCGSNINSTNVMGQTAAHSAASLNHDEVLRILVKWNADLAVKDHWGYDPFYRAMESDQERSIEFLAEERKKRSQKTIASRHQPLHGHGKPKAPF